jgi:hypothetical protein
VLDLGIVQRIVGPQIALNTLEILDLSRSNVATKLGMAPAAYSPVLQGDLLTELPNLASLDLRDYSKPNALLLAIVTNICRLAQRGFVFRVANTAQARSARQSSRSERVETIAQLVAR